MSVVDLPSGLLKPQYGSPLLDRVNPLCNGLIGAWPITAGNTEYSAGNILSSAARANAVKDITDYQNHLTMSAKNNGTDGFWGFTIGFPHKQGDAWSFYTPTNTTASPGFYLSTTPAILKPTVAVSMFWAGMINADTGSSNYGCALALSTYDSSSTDSPYQSYGFARAPHSAGTPDVINFSSSVGGGANSFNVSGITGGTKYGQYLTLGQSLTTGANCAYVNGSLIHKDTSHTGAIQYASSSKFLVNSSSGSGYDTSNWGDCYSTIYALYVWNRVLSSEEFAILHADPMNLLYRHSPQKYFFAKKPAVTEEILQDNPITVPTLVSNITSSATSIAVSSAAYYPTTGNFRLMIDSEIMEATAISPPIITVIRGTEGTTAASHTSATAVNIVTTQQALLGLRSNVNQFGTYANLPILGMQAGDRYKCTDSEYTFIYNGTSWVAFVAGIQVQVPPLISTFTPLNGSFTVANGTRGMIYHQKAVNGSAYTVYGYYKSYASLNSAPAGAIPAPYSAIIGFKAMAIDDVSQMYYGMFTTALTPSTLWFSGVGDSVGSSTIINITASGGYGGSNPINNGCWNWSTGTYKWMKFYDDGTNWNWYFSLNRINWLLLYQTTRTAGYTQIGWGFATNNTGGASNQAMEVFDWQEGTS